MKKNDTVSSDEMVSFFNCENERGLNILIIDDTPMIISALSQILLPLYSVRVAKSGVDGLEIVRSQIIDLILLDIKMPGQDGFEVIKILKQDEEIKKIPVIFLSGATEPEDKERGFALGAADFIGKPFVEEDVLQRVEKILKKS
ncbi:MAG: response regulator [Defluviitaleaceae bacterium]|nr:response regulator [Defluviitaleaceae bacterium]